MKQAVVGGIVAGVTAATVLLLAWLTLILVTTRGSHPHVDTNPGITIVTTP